MDKTDSDEVTGSVYQKPGKERSIQWLKLAKLQEVQAFLIQKDTKMLSMLESLGRSTVSY